MGLDALAVVLGEFNSAKFFVSEFFAKLAEAILMHENDLEFIR